ncbi:hypothetical protein Trisim1_010014 [Trichoderma cf. simile WF8]
MASELHKGEGNELQKPKIVPEDISSNFQAESMTSIAPSLLSLWNEAYEVVKSQLPHQVQFYEQLIELGRIPDTSGLLPRQSMMEPEDAKFRFMDFSKRQQQLEKMISSFLEIGDSKHSYDDDQKFRASKLARNIIKSVVCNLPDAALPWAGLCLCIQKITESKLGSDETMSTITHIVSRMAWYNLLPSLLEDGPTRTTSEDKFMDEKRSSLRSRIIKLYQEIMLCEVQIIYHQFDHPHKEVLAKAQQPKLVKHLASHCTETQRTHTFGKNDMYALSIILCNMVKDEDFTATLFLIDGIDEIGGAIYGLDLSIAAGVGSPLHQVIPFQS